MHETEPDSLHLGLPSKRKKIIVDTAQKNGRGEITKRFKEEKRDRRCPSGYLIEAETELLCKRSMHMALTIWQIIGYQYAHRISRAKRFGQG